MAIDANANYNYQYIYNPSQQAAARSNALGQIGSAEVQANASVLQQMLQNLASNYGADAAVKQSKYGYQGDLAQAQYGYKGDLAQAQYGYKAAEKTAEEGTKQQTIGSVGNIYSSSYDPLAAYYAAYPSAYADMYRTNSGDQRFGALLGLLSPLVGQQSQGGQFNGFTTNYGGGIS